MSEKHTPEALRQLRQVIPFRVALECKHQESVGNLRVILESAELAAEEVEYMLSTLRTQHALLERARESLRLCYEHCRVYHPEVDRNNVGADARATLAAITQHLEPKS